MKDNTKANRVSQHLSALTVFINDIKAMRKFYHETLGWAVLTENEKVVMFKLDKVVLTLCASDVFYDYTGLQPDAAANKSFYSTINLDSPKQVDDSFKKLRESGVNITKMPKKVFWGGYSGFFADPEGNTWEVAYNPISATRA